MNTGDIPTADEIRARMRRDLWRAVDRMTTDSDALVALPFLLKHTPTSLLHPGAITGYAIEPPDDPTPHQFRIHCARVILAMLDRPDVRALLRRTAETPSRAKRHKRVLATAHEVRPEIFTEKPSETAAATELVRDLGKPASPAGGMRVRYGKNSVTITTRKPRTAAPSPEQVRARSAASYNARRHVLQEIANDPNAKEKDRRAAKRVLQKYRHLEAPPNGEA